MVILLAGWTLLAGPSLAAGPPPAKLVPIVVTRTQAGNSADAAGGLTFLDALRAAQADPKDNLITFDAQAFGTENVSIRLSEAISIDGKAAGHDRIDASMVKGGITLDGSDCPDAALTLANGARLTVSRLAIKGGKQRAILISEGTQLHLDQVRIHSSLGPGVALFGSARLTMTGCQLIENQTHGLELHGQAAAAIDNVDFSHNGQSGFAGFDQTSLTARNCRFDANGDWNLVLTSESQAKLLQCQMRRGRFANADASGTAAMAFDRCTIELGQRFGVFATGSARISLTQTQLRKHEGRGIELQDRASLEMDATTVEANGDYGIILFGESKLTASGCTITGNAAHGASLRDQAAGQFNNCIFNRNRYSGIGCLDAASGGQVSLSRCLFRQNGMRPIYRGPLHIDPLIPTPTRINGNLVDCVADPNATIELYVDRAGEATRYLRTIPADRQGRFQVDTAEVPEGWVMTAAATSGGSTSEFNIIAGTNPGSVLCALLSRTGPLSDGGGSINLDALLRRWKPGTRMILNVENSPSPAIDKYLRFMVQRIPEWTNGAITAEMKTGPLGNGSPEGVVVSIRYLEPDAAQLMGRGGVTYMKWDANGYFLEPMEIVLARAQEAQETCPRVLAHEIGHALGLCHARVGLLSRMQGSEPPSPAFVNDFSPTMTYYDVLALQLLHDGKNNRGTTLRQLVERGVITPTRPPQVAQAAANNEQTNFSPQPEQPAAPKPRRGNRR